MAENANTDSYLAVQGGSDDDRHTSALAYAYPGEPGKM